MLRFLTKIRSKAIKDTGLVFIGNLAGQGLGFIATLIVVRHLGPVKFGLFSTAIAVMGLASQFSDLGINTGFVRYASLYLKEDQHKADILFKLTLYVKLGIGLVVLLLGLLISKPLAVHVFHTSEMIPLLRLAFIGSLGTTLWGYLQAILQAKEWFYKYAWINIFNNSIRIVGIFILLYCGSLTNLTAMWVLALVPFAGFFIDGLIIPKAFMKTCSSKRERETILYDLVNLSKWITLSTLCTMIYMRLDIFMLQSLSSSENVGLFSSANQLATVFPLITGSLTIALLPKVSSYKNKDELCLYSRKVISLTPFVLLSTFILIYMSDMIIPFLFGPEYVKSVPIFKIILLGFSISIIINPLSLIFLTTNNARILTLLNFIQLLVAIPLEYLFIIHYGPIGAAWVSVVIRIFALVYISFCLARYLNKSEIRI